MTSDLPRELQSDADLANRRGFIFRVATKSRPGASWQTVDGSIGGLAVAYRFALDISAHEVGIITAGDYPYAGFIYWTSRFPNVFNATVLNVTPQPLSDAGARQFLDACACGNLATVTQLLEGGLDPNNVQDARGCSSLHIAAAADELDIALTLLRANANVNAQDRSGHTPLWCAVEMQLEGASNDGLPLNLAMASLLLDAGADPNIGTQSAIALAEESGWTEAMQLMHQRTNANDELRPTSCRS